MARTVDNAAGESRAEDREALLRAVAEDLKAPLLYIARQSELAQGAEAVTLEELRTIQANADAAIRLVDGYMLGLDLAQQELPLELEPVSLSSLLYDVAQAMQPVLRARGASVELILAGKYGQVMAHRTALTAALQCMGMVLTTALNSIETVSRPQLTLAVHRSPQGIITGLYASSLSSSLALSGGQKLHGRAAQPFADTLYSSGAGVFVAQQLLGSMGSRLRDGRFRGQYGLAATLQPSQQLRMMV